MIDIQVLSSAISLLMTIAISSPSLSYQFHRKCFSNSGYCLSYNTDVVEQPTTTDDADAFCRRNGGKLLELPDERRRRDFESLVAELNGLDLGIPKKMKFFINLRKIPSRNRWMWLRSDATAPYNSSLHPAKILPTGLPEQTNDADACTFVRRIIPNGLVFGAAPCSQTKGYICKTANCQQPPCYQVFFQSDWTQISGTCSLASVLDLVGSSQGQDPTEVLEEFERRILISVGSRTEDLWIGLTKYYWTWNSTGTILDKNLLPWSRDANGGIGADDCLLSIINFPSLTLDNPTGGIAWGVVCMEEIIVPATNLSEGMESSSSTTSSSSSTTTTTTLSSSSPSSSSTTTLLLLSSLSTTATSSLSSVSSALSSLLSSISSPSSSSLLLPLHTTTVIPQQLQTTTSTAETTTTKFGNSSLEGNALTIALVLGIALGVLTLLVVAMLIFRIKKKKAKLKEREASEEFHFSTEMGKHEDPVNAMGETIVLDSMPDILGDGTASFSTKILKSITSGDKIPARPVTPTIISLDAPTMFKNYENLPCFNTSFT